MSDATNTFAAETDLVDVINTLACEQSVDTLHRIHFRNGDALTSMTLAELDRRVIALAHRLRALGVGRRDRVGVMSLNRLEWVLIDLAVMKLGGVTAAVEPSRFTPEHIIDRYDLALLFGEGVTTRGRVYAIDEVAAWAEDPGADLEPLPAFGGYDPADICQIKQTSGSTGVPKGIETTAVSVNSSMTAVQRMFSHEDGDNILVFLPLWFLQQRWWVYSALVFHHDVTVVAVEEAVEAAQAVSPTVLMGVPRFWDDLKARIEAAHPDLPLSRRRDVIQQTLGGRVRYLWTGSAPATRKTLDYFNDGGVPLYEGYGQNETCIVAKNCPGAFRVGSVGKVLPDKRIRFDRDGVLIVASKYPVNTRYTWCSPGDNEKMFLPTGEVKTYDLARVDEDGFLYMLGRVDDVISPSAGPNVLVTTVEELLRDIDGIHDCVLYGNGKRFMTAIVSPASATVDPLALSAQVAALNEQLRSEQRTHAIVVAPERFSVDNGLLNTQFKPRRKEIHRRFAMELEWIYDKHNDDETPPDPPLVIPASAGATLDEEDRA